MSLKTLIEPRGVKMNAYKVCCTQGDIQLKNLVQFDKCSYEIMHKNAMKYIKLITNSAQEIRESFTEERTTY